MTREEAIEVLKLVDENASCDDCLYYAQMEDCPTDEDCIIRKAIEMAIQALSQEPCDDAISRADAQTEIMMSKSLVSFDRDIWIKTKDAVQIIRDLPSVTQKSKTGHWLRITTINPKEFCNRCSECGYEQFYAERYKFCPNCGAEMVESQESEE